MSAAIRRASVTGVLVEAGLWLRWVTIGAAGVRSMYNSRGDFGMLPGRSYLVTLRPV
jgi:hypothetical protein